MPSEDQHGSIFPISGITLQQQLGRVVGGSRFNEGGQIRRCSGDHRGRVLSRRVAKMVDGFNNGMDQTYLLGKLGVI